MGEKRRTPFQGFLDTTSEMSPARELSSGVLTISGVRRSAKVSGANDPPRPEVVEPNAPKGMQRPSRADPPRRAAQAEQAHTAEDSHPRQLTQHP